MVSGVGGRLLLYEGYRLCLKFWPSNKVQMKLGHITLRSCKTMHVKNMVKELGKSQIKRLTSHLTFILQKIPQNTILTTPVQLNQSIIKTQSETNKNRIKCQGIPHYYSLQI
jgi:hypothetical protein